MNEYIIYLDTKDEEYSSDVTISADSFEISKDEQYVYFKHGMQTIGFFKMCEVLGVAKQD